MRRPLLLSTLGVLALVGTAFAGQDKPAEAWAGGVIVKVDATARTIDVRQGDHDQTYSLAPDAKVVQNKKDLKGTDLSASVGHQVRIRYVAEGDARVASSVAVLGLRKESPSAAARIAPNTQTPTSNP